MKTLSILLLALFLTIPMAQGQVHSPTTSSTTTTVGAELDVLPYVSGGYYGSLWVGSKYSHRDFVG